MNIFITGTDTDCGKTWVTAGLVRGAAASGVRALGMKPVASGAVLSSDQEWINEDVETLRRAGSVALPRRTVNPYCYELPASPHIAAAGAAPVDLAVIRQAYGDCADAADFVAVEGVGGWLVPLNQQDSVADLAVALDLPVLLVVAVKLGCINHALLSAQALRAAPVRCCGWVANCLQQDLAAADAVVDTLRERLPWPLLAAPGHNEPTALHDLGARLAAARAGEPASW